MNPVVRVEVTLGNYAYGTDQNGNTAATFSRQDGISECARCGRDFTSGWVIGQGWRVLEFCGGCVHAVAE